VIVEDLIGLIIAPLIVFLVIVAPIWLVLHYRSKRQLSQGLSEGDYTQLHELAATADKMTTRIKTLEAILDAEAPQWRNKV
jgi:phage shock protein B